MTNDRKFPVIKTQFDTPHDNSDNQIFSALIDQALKEIVSEETLHHYRHGPSSYQQFRDKFNSQLPLFVTNEKSSEFPKVLSFYTIFSYRTGAFKYFFEIISRWLIPGRKLTVQLMYAADFSMPEISSDIYTLCEQVIRIESQEDWEVIQQNLPLIESDLILGIPSAYRARQILEIKGLKNDEKTGMIQEHLANIVTRLPKHISFDVFTEMQHVMVISREEFKAARDVQHLSRMISIQYLFRKRLRQALRKQPDKRHLYVKLFKAKIRDNTEEKPVLGLIVAMNFLRDKELFEETHLVRAIENYVPNAKPLKGSFCYSRRGKEPICTLYIEFEKEDGTPFTGKEVQMLREELPVDLKGRIEHMMHPVFMPRNEEEIMRNILTLSQQIRFLRDIPQMFITFDEQTHSGLYFTVTLVRIIIKDNRSIQEIFNDSDTFLDYFHDRIKTLGTIRKKYPKEATVFRVKVDKDQFLRQDHSIDLYKARLTVVNEISRLVGDIRDYNGGMISKQNELLMNVRDELNDTPNYNELLLENFFYSLNPVIMRTVLEPEALKKLYIMLVDAISEGFFNDESYAMRIRAEPNFVYVMIGAEDRRIEEAIRRVIEEMGISSTALATSCVSVYDNPYMGYIFRCDDPKKQREFCMNVQSAVEFFENEIAHRKG